MNSANYRGCSPTPALRSLRTWLVRRAGAAATWHGSSGDPLRACGYTAVPSLRPSQPRSGRMIRFIGPQRIPCFGIVTAVCHDV